MSATEEQCRNGVAFIIDLDQLTRETLTHLSFNKFLGAMEHQVPTSIEVILLVNVPSWFMGTWKSLRKTAVSETFAKRFHFLGGSNQLGDYLMTGYEKYMPRELGYWRDSNEMVEDFIDKKVHFESCNRSFHNSIQSWSTEG
jgi:hypothetical protein